MIDKMIDDVYLYFKGLKIRYQEYKIKKTLMQKVSETQKEPEISDFDSLIESERYINSNFIIQKINDKYALKSKNSGLYVDLKSNSHRWNNKDRFFVECLGSQSDVIRAFDYVEPVIIEYNIENEY